jgi:hypothetical protein
MLHATRVCLAMFLLSLATGCNSSESNGSTEGVDGRPREPEIVDTYGDTPPADQPIDAGDAADVLDARVDSPSDDSAADAEAADAPEEGDAPATD